MVGFSSPVFLHFFSFKEPVFAVNIIARRSCALGMALNVIAQVSNVQQILYPSILAQSHHIFTCVCVCLALTSHPITPGLLEAEVGGRGLSHCTEGATGAV